MRVSRMHSTDAKFPAYFSTTHLDRLSARRDDGAWLTAAMSAADTRFIPVCGAANICRWQDTVPRALLLDAATVQPLLPQHSNLIFLGASQGLNYFALGLPEETSVAGGKAVDLRQ